jgi:hypothetical protein
MNKRINFEDNVFILEQQIRIIRDVLALDPDPDLFLDKTMYDLGFIDSTLGILLGNLIENTRLIEREDAFDSLQHLESLFGRILAELLNGTQTLSAEMFPAIRDKITLFRSGSAERIKLIDKNAGTHVQSSSDPVVSSLELAELLKDF